MTVPKKILLAEDDADDQTLFLEFLQHRSDIVSMPVVENGVELIEALQKIINDADLPDIILLDQNMPKRNGIQTLQLLKESDRFRHIPVVIYSTYADENLIMRATQMGATSVVVKPISKNGYNEMIDAFLKVVV